ncbi:Tn3 family transposase [Nocardiopsis sp. DSM 44743]|uniref:Tn3 family transposase n=1 Tax=Nocardiopsis lambiniae TaxID=3075539 RepID=A0ABU2M6X5_9ACTN|nr:Tn3 family transposase [Nocardiopsis sp. DSM 44743]MDT0328425.1 Tn3 family transposase [Nocardiopsis sp. DSM 44743]
MGDIPPGRPRSRGVPRPDPLTGAGRIAHHYVSDTYVALFSRFIPCGAREAVHLIEGLLDDKSDVQPSTVHADTQGRSAPLFTPATLFGFDLMPRIRDFKDLTFFRASDEVLYPGADELSGERGRNVIDRRPIEDTGAWARLRLGREPPRNGGASLRDGRGP